MFDTKYQADSISPLNKGLGCFEQALAPNSACHLGWNLLREDLSLPAAVLYEERIAHNLRWMQQFVREYSVNLAPHGKTTMTPKLFARQLAAGAWGITLATAHQTHVGYHHGVRRVLMANQLVGRINCEIISQLLRDPTFEFFCLVDSADNVDYLGRFFGERGQSLQVLLELGVGGGRTGVRNGQQQAEVLHALERWPQVLKLAGVEIYEGVLKEEQPIRQFLRRAVETVQTMAKANRFAREPVILSGAGSAWYDVVAEEFSQPDIGIPLEVVLRPGCYLTHDVGVYKAAQEQIQIRNPIARKMQVGLLPALQLWAYAQSIPEPNTAIIGLGKRDAAFDAGLPQPARHFRPGQPAPTDVPAHWALTAMMDQHAFLKIAEQDDLKVGDMIAFDISHPCLTFDKWKHIPILDAGYQVIDIVQTFF